MSGGFSPWRPFGGDADGAGRAAEHERLIEAIRDETRLTAAMTGIAEISPAVLQALRDTPREEFIDAAERPFAYLDRPLPLAFGQTISQPFIVALMTEMLRPAPTQVVLEVGSGSGYQAAVLARLVERVISVEIIPALAERAARVLQRLGIGNVEVHCADGYRGWPAAAPYDAIIVTACARHVPPALTEQLKPGGRLAIPVGVPHGEQDLLRIVKNADGSVETKPVLPVAFVPLTRAPEEKR